MEPKRVAVIGAGISGLSSALHILEEAEQKAYKVDVTVIADKHSDETTSWVAGGFFEIEDISTYSEPHRIKKWFKETGDYFSSMTQQGDNVKRGIIPVFAVLINYDFGEIAEYFPMHHKLTEKEMIEMFPQLKNVNFEFNRSVLIQTFLCRPHYYMPWIKQQVRMKGGKFCMRRIHSLLELQLHYDVVVNCSGVYSRTLVPDFTVQPARGQTVRVKAPWINFAILKKGSCPYIFPDLDGCLTLGGTYDLDTFDTTPCPVTRKRIIDECIQFMPSLKDAEYIGDSVGLRPLRKGGPRVDVEIRNGLPIVHNYGHDSKGWSLHWGCAREVACLVMKHIGSSSKL